MVRRIFAVVAVMAFTGCPYTEGCDGTNDSSPGSPDDAGTGADGDPTDPDGAGGDGSGPDSGIDSGLGPATSIDFGTEPVGGPALSTLSCPPLTMPKAAPTVYVDANASGAESGTKAAPYRTVAKAFESSAARGIVWIAAGTYTENVVIPDKDLVVFGGFASGFGSRTNACATILEAANVAQPVLSADATVKSFAIEGATVRKGARGLFVAGDPTGNANFTVARCVFSENGQTAQVGGAIALDQVNARIFGSVFKDNKASKGAGLSCGGPVNLVVDQNLFDKNLGYSDHGGGIYLSAKTSKVTRNTFRGNATGVGIPAGFGGNWGGAAIVYKNSDLEPATADFSYNVFTDNLAGIGSCVFVDEGATLTMSHDLMYRNRAYLENGFVRGGAIYADGTGFAGGGSTFIGEYLTVVNNIYDENGVARAPASAFGGNLYVEGFSKGTVSNSIFWNNGDNGFYVEAQNEINVSNTLGAPQCTSSDAMGFIPASPTICKIGANVFLPAGAINFVDEAANDYHEKSTSGHYSAGAWVLDAVSSPAIDKGDPAATVGSEPAPNGGRANLGAFARTIEASKSP